MGSEVDVRPRLLHRSWRRGDVHESGTALEKPPLEGGVFARRCPMRIHAMVPENSRRLGEFEVLGRIGQQDGAAVESQLHDWRMIRVLARSTLHGRTPHLLIPRGTIRANAQRWIHG